MDTDTSRIIVWRVAQDRVRKGLVSQTLGVRLEVRDHGDPFQTFCQIDPGDFPPLCLRVPRSTFPLSRPTLSGRCPHVATRPIVGTESDCQRSAAELVSRRFSLGKHIWCQRDAALRRSAEAVRGGASGRPRFLRRTWKLPNTRSRAVSFFYNLSSSPKLPQDVPRIEPRNS